MEESFWHQKWERNEIAFHQREANPLLVKYFGDLSLPKGSRVFVPLCGKTRDIHWLLSQGYQVAGAELSQLAVEQLFADLGVEPNITAVDSLSRYSANNIDIFVGDIFGLSRSLLGQIDAIYDRAALVAFPEPMRDRYAVHLVDITDHAPQLLISYEYDQRLLDGPPFSVSDDEVIRRYQESYDLKLFAKVEVKGGLKGRCAATENVWLLKKQGATRT
ncbi:MAG TPA: thiopurine S-methyltransferase [Granulicella sp.]|jgi:thiopurine S-methyltransferase